MSSFCSQCSPETFDIDLLRIAAVSKRGSSEDFICKGCNNRGIYKDKEGNVFLRKLINEELQQVPVRWVDL